MREAKSVSTPLVEPSLTKAGTRYSNPTEYRVVIGLLQYLGLIRPDIAFAVNKLAQYMQHPTIDHWSALKILLRYIVGMINYGLALRKDNVMSLHAYSDADWVRDNDDYISTSAYSVHIGSNHIS